MTSWILFHRINRESREAVRGRVYHAAPHFLLAISAFLSPVSAAPQTSYRTPWLRDVAAELGSRQEDTYTNPIIEGNFADPWVFEYNNSYYLVPTVSDGGVSIFKSDSLDNFHNPEKFVLFTPPNPPIWALELHRIDGNWYVYGAFPDGPEDAGRRMHTLVGSDSNDPTAPFSDLGQIGTPDSNYAIDGTVLHNYNGKNYFIWSGKASRDTGTVQYIYIAEMDTPWSVIGERVVIHSPYNEDGSRKEWQWSPNDCGVNKGPHILDNGHQTFVIYSACCSWDPCYCLAIMVLNGTELNPLDPAAWWANDEGPVFKASSATVGVGHASFTVDREGDHYVIYHGWAAGDEAGWGSRTSRAQAFTFNPDGTLNFPEPASILPRDLIQCIRGLLGEGLGHSMYTNLSQACKFYIIPNGGAPPQLDHIDEDVVLVSSEDAIPDYEIQMSSASGLGLGRDLE